MDRQVAAFYEQFSVFQCCIQHRFFGHHWRARGVYHAIATSCPGPVGVAGHLGFVAGAHEFPPGQGNIVIYLVKVGFCYEPPGQESKHRDVREGTLVDSRTFPKGEPLLPWEAWVKKGILVPVRDNGSI